MLILALLLTAPDDGAAKRDAVVARCAIPAERLAVEASPASDIVTMLIRGDAPLSDTQLECLGAVLSEPEVMGPSFEDAALGKRYGYLAGRSNLRSMGLLDRLPVFDPARDTLPGFAHRIERLCRARRGSLVATGDNIHITVAALNTPSERYDRVICMVGALDASGYEPFAIEVPVPITPVS